MNCEFEKSGFTMYFKSYVISMFFNSFSLLAPFLSHSIQKKTQKTNCTCVFASYRTILPIASDAESDFTNFFRTFLRILEQCIWGKQRPKYSSLMIFHFTDHLLHKWHQSKDLGIYVIHAGNWIMVIVNQIWHWP